MSSLKKLLISLQEIKRDQFAHHYIESKMIGLIFGENNFPKEILKQIKKIKKKYLIIDLTKKKIFKKDKNSYSVSIGNRNHLQGLNLIGLRRKNYENKKIMELNKAYDEIFSSKNLHENLSKINIQFKGNELVNEIINFIAKDKKRAICTPINKE